MLLATAALAATTILGPSAPAPSHMPAPMPRPPHRLSMALRPAGRPREEDDPFASTVFTISMDEGRVLAHINKPLGIGYMDAKWPYSAAAMDMLLARAQFYGFVPIPEAESPAELLGNGFVRIYFEEID